MALPVRDSCLPSRLGDGVDLVVPRRPGLKIPASISCAARVTAPSAPSENSSPSRDGSWIYNVCLPLCGLFMISKSANGPLRPPLLYRAKPTFHSHGARCSIESRLSLSKIPAAGGGPSSPGTSCSGVLGRSLAWQVL